MFPCATLNCIIIPTVRWTWRERVHTHNCAPPQFPDQKHTVKERGRGGKMIVSLLMFGWTADEQTQKTTGVRGQSASQIKKGTHTRTHMYAPSHGQQPITDRHSMLFPNSERTVY